MSAAESQESRRQRSWIKEDVTEDRTSLSDKLSCDGSKAGNRTSERSSEDISKPDRLIDEKFSACELKLNAEDSTLGINGNEIDRVLRSLTVLLVLKGFYQ